MKRFIFLLVMGVLLLTSCGATYRVGYRADINTFVGMSYHQIIERLGEPTREYDEADGFVLVYEGTPEIFTYTYTYGRNYGVPIAKFLMGNDEICHDVTLYNTEPVWVPYHDEAYWLLLILLILL